MKQLRTSLASIVLVLGIALGNVQAQPQHHNKAPKQTQSDAVTGATQSSERQHKPHSNTINITQSRTCKVSLGHDGMYFAAIDSVDNSIDIIAFQNDTMIRVARYKVDSTERRHDINNILRAKSVTASNGNVIFIASSQKDSSVIGVLSLPKGELIALKTLSCRCNTVTVDHGNLIITGSNNLGYSISIIDISNGVEHLDQAQTTLYNYRVPQKSDEIKKADKHGWGLTMVLVLVVFSVLFLIVVLLNIFSKLVARSQNKSKQEQASTDAGYGGNNQTLSHAPVGANNIDEEVNAAIATAVYLYKHQHDEAPSEITIRKSERSWSPWNAKFYNMNRYFFNRK